MSVEWMVAFAGEQYGPYKKDELLTLIKNQQINPKKSYIWTKGMKEWVLLIEHDQFQDVLNEINLNIANLDEIIVLPGFDLVKAEKLIETRVLNDGFKDIYEISECIGLKPHEMNKIIKMENVIVRKV